MDLVKALQYLSAVKDQFTAEEYIEAQKVLQNFEISLNELLDLYETMGGEKPSETIQLISIYEIIKKDILAKFE